MMTRKTCALTAAIAAAFLCGAAVALLVTGKPSAERAKPPAEAVSLGIRHDDAGLVKSLLGEDLSDRTFDFSTVVKACSEREVIPLDSRPGHQKVIAAIHSALKETLADLNLENSPVRSLRRINEASRFFEDGIMERINRVPGLRCDIPPTRDGDHQRSGYPDLKIVDKQSGQVFYLDPKLVEAGSETSTFRTFYFEPKDETLKINDDAVHLLVGIEHDGQAQAWTFTGWRLVDLSTLKVRLKAEFQASYAELYRKSVLSLPGSIR